MPETAVAGTFHEADTAQLLQSTRPVPVSVAHAGWFWTPARCTVSTLRAARPP